MICTKPNCQNWALYSYEHEGRTERVCSEHQREVDHHMEALGRTGPLALNPVVYTPLPPRDAPEPDWHAEWRRLNDVHQVTLAQLDHQEEENHRLAESLAEARKHSARAHQETLELRALLGQRPAGEINVDVRLELERARTRAVHAEREASELRRQLEETRFAEADRMLDALEAEGATSQSVVEGSAAGERGGAPGGGV